MQRWSATHVAVAIPPCGHAIAAAPERGPLAVVFDAASGASRLGFARHTGAQSVVGAYGPVSARAWTMTVPYWFIVLLVSAMPLLWLRVTGRGHLSLVGRISRVAE